MTGDKKINDCLKLKIYQTVIWLIAFYGAECWPATKVTDHCRSMLDTKMVSVVSLTLATSATMTSGSDMALLQAPKR